MAICCTTMIITAGNSYNLLKVMELVPAVLLNETIVFRKLVNVQYRQMKKLKTFINKIILFSN